ncbi:MAG: hypothetical protein QXR30_02790 [Candidatus Woesearchaeota archaeon]
MICLNFRKKVVLFGILLFLNIFLVFSNIFLYVDVERNNYSYFYINTSKVYIPTNSSGKYELVLYNELDQEMYSVRFKDSIYLIIPYDLSTYKYAKVFDSFYELFSFNLELCNYNNICEYWEYECSDCIYLKNATNVTYYKPIKKQETNYLVFVILMLSVLAMMIFFYFKYLRKKFKDQNSNMDVEVQNNSIFNQINN